MRSVVAANRSSSSCSPSSTVVRSSLTPIGAGPVAGNEPWYLGLRAENLLMVHLTRRDDLIVSVPRSDNTGLDCLVSITKEHRDTGRVFGVILKAGRSLRPSLIPGDTG